jgi:hypothetical protein
MRRRQISSSGRLLSPLECCGIWQARIASDGAQAQIGRDRPYYGYGGYYRPYYAYAGYRRPYYAYAGYRPYYGYGGYRYRRYGYY